MLAADGIAVDVFEYRRYATGDAAGLAAFWAWWDGVLGLLAQLGVRNANANALLGAVATK